VIQALSSLGIPAVVGHGLAQNYRECVSELRQALTAVNDHVDQATIPAAAGGDTRERASQLAAAVERLERTLMSPEISSARELALKIETNINTILRRLVDQYSTKARERGIELSIVETLEDAVVLGAASELKAMLEPLVANAVNHAFPLSLPEAKIEVMVAKAQDSRAIVTISDNGVGISPNWREEARPAHSLYHVLAAATLLTSSFEIDHLTPGTRVIAELFLLN
jgi:signal transduction histidine kinase